MQPTRTRLTLDIELDSDPIQGSLSARERASQAFSGWIELVSLLQDAATTQASQPDERGSLGRGRATRARYQKSKEE
jgi:hypothetical protein